MRHALWLLVMPLAGCASARGGAASSECGPVQASLEQGVSLEPLAGEFRLTLVAQDGRSIVGELTLMPAPAGTPPPAIGARTAFIGSLEIRLEAVGARRLGDIQSRDPAAPGIAVYEQRSAAGAVTVTARLGSRTTAAPTPGMQQIEGEYMALFVRSISAGGFAGGWNSGDGSIEGEARGHFCAVRRG
jgi:hypothetical protein